MLLENMAETEAFKWARIIEMFIIEEAEKG
jgi:hypothetical protein